jgi:HTH-type transcriptional regulator/antitoxin MqsA
MNDEQVLCPQCEKGHLHAATWEDDFRHGDKTVHVAGLECYRCDNCDADPVFADQIRRNQSRIADAKRRADGMLVGDEIRCIREQLDLSQQDAALLFGGGTNAFSKYERGDVLQSVAMDRLLKIVAYCPWLADFLRHEANIAVNPEQRIDVSRYQAGVAVDMRDASFRSRTVAGHLKVVSAGTWQKAAA